MQSITGIFRRSSSSRWPKWQAHYKRQALAMTTRAMPTYAPLMLVTDDNHLDEKFLDKIQGALKGGVTSVQLRLKKVSTREYIHWGERVQELTRAVGVPLIIDDRLDVALAIDAEGLHVGDTDMPWHMARRLLGPDRLLGCSTYGQPDLVQYAMRPDVKADYLGSGSIFPSPTKPNSTAKGVGHLPELNRVVSSEAASRMVPILAIGGVDLDSAGRCVEAGADGVAVVSGLLRYDDALGTRAAAEATIAAVQAALHNRNARGGSPCLI